MELYACNLYSQDCSLAAELYENLFGWRVEVKTASHSELTTDNGNRIIFSKESSECPASPGTITILGFPNEKVQKSFQPEVIQTKYSSYLDPWNNRIWFFPKK